MKTITVITPVWNRCDLTHNFLASHWRYYKKQAEVGLIIIDNGSTDPTRVYLDYWLDLFGQRLRVLEQPSNIGFGPANNLAIQAALSDILIFLSNDVEIQGDYIQVIQESVEGGALYGAELFSHDTGWNRFKETGIIPYLAGWCLVSTKPTWETLGGFDEQFVPCDYEDMDLSLRAARQGLALKPLNLPLHHQFGQTAQQIDRLTVTLTNRQRFMTKWGLTE